MAMIFQVNLQNLGTYTGALQPYDPINEASLANNFPKTRVTWFPDGKLENRERPDGATITVSGLAAVYLKNTYTTGPYAFLTYVSGTA